MVIPVFYRIENFVGTGENAGIQHFLLFPQCFQKTSFSMLLGHCLLKVTLPWGRSLVKILMDVYYMKLHSKFGCSSP